MRFSENASPFLKEEEGQNRRASTKREEEKEEEEGIISKGRERAFQSIPLQCCQK